MLGSRMSEEKFVLPKTGTPLKLAYYCVAPIRIVTRS
jgi:hypothetical protein